MRITDKERILKEIQLAKERKDDTCIVSFECGVLDYQDDRERAVFFLLEQGLFVNTWSTTRVSEHIVEVQLEVKPYFYKNWARKIVKTEGKHHVQKKDFCTKEVVARNHLILGYKALNAELKKLGYEIIFEVKSRKYLGIFHKDWCITSSVKPCKS